MLHVYFPDFAGRSLLGHTERGWLSAHQLHTCINLQLGNVQKLSLKLMQIGDLYPEGKDT